MSATYLGLGRKITEYEHLPRYVFAKQFAQGARILDFGCGTGYVGPRFSLNPPNPCLV